jgi:hypothetical protein
MLRDTALGEVDVADEEGGEMGLLSVRLLLGKGNQPWKISTHKRSNAKQYRQWTQQYPLSLLCGPRKQLNAEYKELRGM